MSFPPHHVARRSPRTCKREFLQHLSTSNLVSDLLESSELGWRDEFDMSGSTEAQSPSRRKPPSNALQREVMQMVYNEITAYPPEDWCKIIGRLINRDANQVSVWFGNQRQRDARARDPNDAFVKPPYVHCASRRRIRMRPSALQYFPEDQWSDELLEEIVMIEHFRRLQRSLARGASSHEA